MNEVEFVRLDEVEIEKIVELMNEEAVGKQMPLLAEGFSLESCRHFLQAKKQLWDKHGYGPWAFLIHGEFAGWGGLQWEEGDADFALVLHPKYWGWGKKVFDKVKKQAFSEMNLTSITILLPPSRPNSKAVRRFGFVEDGEVSVGGEIFERFRLWKS